MTFEERVNEGLQGRYKGLNNGFERINKYIFGIQRSCYMLIGGQSGAAKTTFVDYMLINAIQDSETNNIPINIFYYSLEIDEFSKKANWLSTLIYNKYNIVVNPEKIKGLGNFRLNDDEQELVNSELPELNKLWSKINWIWESTNPTGIYKSMWNHMVNRGTFIKEPYVDENGKTQERIVKFINNNSKEYNILIGDHQALLSIERGYTLKENLDKNSEYCVKLRNLFGLTIIWLAQFNQGLSSVERAKFKGVDISPQQADFKDTTTPYADCDIALGLMNAYKMDMETCLGYNINKPFSTYNLKDRFRMVKIIKNRLSRDNIAIGLLFQAEAGSFEELKPAKEINENDIIRFNRLTNR